MKDMNARPTTLRSFPQGGLFVTLGVLSLLGNLFAQAPALAGVSVSLAMAGVVGWRGYRRRGYVPNSVIWWVFGTCFAFFFALGRVVGLSPEQVSQWFPALSFLMVGGIMLLRRRL